MTAVVSAMDIGGTHVSAANVALETGSIVAGQSFREPLDGAASAAEIVDAIARCARRLPASPGGRWAVALPGPFDHERGIGRYEGVAKFEALRDFDLRAALERRLPAGARLSFHHDADAFLLGEWWTGAARHHRRAAGITLGTGVGSCFLRDGHILRDGPGIPPEGRVDLLRYAGRPLEDTVSRRAIRRAYAEATGRSPGPDVREIAQCARQGDTVAGGVLARAFRTLGEVLGPCLVASGATVLVVGGSIAASWDLVAGPLRAGTTVAVEPARHPADAALLGAAYLAAVRD
ncbi:ROK family protein [Paractinoplanes globisporus]|uniref:ROK family protein n=1 Tax=Paractinoplanes globisporus TaxID=113565 RepID=A0ABW6WAK3_9ACTN|nr:ROK family protein [Actinoplanes globisporus]